MFARSFFQPILDPRTPPDQVALWVCLIIGAIFVCCLWARETRRFSQSATTVLGILGTFIGIFLGLQNFDTNNIEHSVPPLLAGLKTAFLTSIIGITATLLTRTIGFLIFRKSRRNTDEASVHKVAELLQEQMDAQRESHTESLAAVQSLGNLLKEMEESAKENHKQTLESLESTRTSISGEDDTSLLTQVTRLRTTFADKQDDLIKEFRCFAENMAEANSQKLIEALEEVMRDFNTRINEQFGDNFKQLNEGVGKLVGWQEKYADQTETMIAQFDRTVSTIETVRDSIAQIAERSIAITEAAEKLDPILAAIQEQRRYMEGYLREFADISEKAQTLLPTLDAKIHELTDNFSESVRQSIRTNHESINKQNEFAQTVISGFNNMDKRVSDAIETVEESSKGSIELMRAYMEDAESQQKELVSNLVDRLNTQVRESFTKAEEELIRLTQESARNTEARMEAIDRGLGEELGKALNALGDRLASLSEKFSSDYAPLTDKLNRALDIARGADGDARR